MFTQQESIENEYDNGVISFWFNDKNSIKNSIFSINMEAIILEIKILSTVFV
jgi:hypothetical protein